MDIDLFVSHILCDLILTQNNAKFFFLKKRRQIINMIEQLFNEKMIGLFQEVLFLRRVIFLWTRMYNIWISGNLTSHYYHYIEQWLFPCVLAGQTEAQINGWTLVVYFAPSTIMFILGWHRGVWWQMFFSLFVVKVPTTLQHNGSTFCSIRDWSPSKLSSHLVLIVTTIFFPQSI